MPLGRESDDVIAIGDRFQLGRPTEVSKGSLAIHHLVEDAAQRPHVCWLACLVGHDPFLLSALLLDGLGRHVVGRPNDIVPSDVEGSDGDLFSNTKVDDLDPTLNHQEIGGLQIGMEESGGVNEMHRGEHLLVVLGKRWSRQGMMSD